MDEYLRGLDKMNDLIIYISFWLVYASIGFLFAQLAMRSIDEEIKFDEWLNLSLMFMLFWVIFLVAFVDDFRESIDLGIWRKIKSIVNNIIPDKAPSWVNKGE